ncbi:putative alcohol dehydrogenase [Durotheca rogersii]|uniref:putative alcohol dehydrogenase n=1 Tax=Durotheca rogersii TaxID=419775 RepID=UPI002220C0F1|nr:putative alcohol dehydrogenase [Durotheca rogersii]KAI5867644.1 putative alcohol dehydrogenase [Durotheca rogersii]
MDKTQAIIVLEEQNGAAIRDVPVPKLRDDCVLVEVKAIGLSPTDWKHIDFGAADAGSRIGCDYAGLVHDVGKKVSRFRKGDRIAGAVHGGDRTNHDNGAFAHYIVAKADVAIHVPNNISDVEAATLGVSLITIGQSLYKTLKLPLPTMPALEPFPLLVHAGSTSTALLGIQFAKASGLTVVATASPYNFDHVRMAGADAVFDYKSPTCSEDIKRYTENTLCYAWDCMGTGIELCANALSDAEPSIYTTLNPVEGSPLKRINTRVNGPYFTLAYDAFGEEYVWMEETVPRKPDEIEFAANFLLVASSLLAEGVVVPVKPVVNSTGEGLEGALVGLDELRAGNVSGSKLVYTL